MIKRIIGTLFTLVTLAIVVFAIMNWGNYRSTIFDTKSSDTATTDIAAEPDSITVEVEPQPAVDGEVEIKSER